MNFLLKSQSCTSGFDLSPFSIKLCQDSPCFCSNSWISVLGSSSVSVSPSLSGSSAAGDWGWDWGCDWNWDWDWDWDWDWLTDRIWIFIPRSGASEPKKAAGPSIPAAGKRQLLLQLLMFSYCGNYIKLFVCVWALLALSHLAGWKATLL